MFAVAGSNRAGIRYIYVCICICIYIWHKAKNPGAVVYYTTAKTKTNIWAQIQALFCPVEHMSSQIHISGTAKATLMHQWNPLPSKLSGCVHTNAPFQTPYLLHMKSKQRLGAASGWDHTSEFSFFTNLDKRPSSNKPRVQQLLFIRQPATEAAPLNDWWLLKAVRRNRITARSNDVWNLIEHQSILITAMLTTPGKGWRIRARKGFACVYFAPIVHCLD